MIWTFWCNSLTTDALLLADNFVTNKVGPPLGFITDNSIPFGPRKAILIYKSTPSLFLKRTLRSVPLMCIF